MATRIVASGEASHHISPAQGVTDSPNIFDQWVAEGAAPREADQQAAPPFAERFQRFRWTSGEERHHSLVDDARDVVGGVQELLQIMEWDDLRVSSADARAPIFDTSSRSVLQRLAIGALGLLHEKIDRECDNSWEVKRHG